jgi:hypothetical protein
MQRLNHVIAKAKDVKSETTSRLSDLYKVIQKGELFKGHTRRWARADDEGPSYQNEDKLVQHMVDDILAEARVEWSRVMDSDATRDYANMSACADVVVQGITVLKAAPVPFLLTLEKNLKDMKDFVSKLPVLDPGERWVYDESDRLFKGQPRESYKSKKIERAQVVVPPTEQHPAQWTKLSEDITEGTWTTTLLCSALTSSRKRDLIDRVTALQEAVHIARETANMAEAPQQEVSKAVFNFVFGG